MERRIFIQQSARLSLAALMGIPLLGQAQAGNQTEFIHSFPNNNMKYTSELSTNAIISTVFKSKGREIKVHAIQTGLIAVKKNFLTKKGSGLMSKLNIALDREYEDFMPIWVWLIEHPEGTILIDTGEIEASDHQEFYKKEGMVSKFNLRAMNNRRIISRSDELDIQLERLGIKTSQINKVVLTHLHGDHTDGLKFFKGNEIIVYEEENKHPYGNLPTTYPSWFQPELVNYLPNRVDIFEQAFPLVKSEDIWLVPTPGHTHYHSSVLMQTDEGYILFAGDVSYRHDQVLNNQYGGSNIDYKKSAKTYQQIKDFAQRHPLIYLPSHDTLSAQRLAERKFLIS